MNKILRNLMWMMTGLLAAFSVSAQCTYTFSASDSWGDGWNGGFIEVSDCNSGAVLFTWAGVPAGGSSETTTFDFDEGIELCISYTDGDFDAENDLTISDCNGNTVFQGNMGNFDNDDLAPDVLVANAVVPAPLPSCTWTLDWVDTFGDGWNGFTVTVSINGVAGAMISPTGGFSGSETITVIDGATVSFDITADGAFDTEVGFTLTDPFFNVVADFPDGSFGAGTDTQNVYSGTNACPLPCALICPIAGSGTWQEQYYLQSGECCAEVTIPLEIQGFCQVLGETINGLSPEMACTFEGVVGANVANCPDNNDSFDLEAGTFTLQASDPADFGGGGANTCTFFGHVYQFAVPSGGQLCFDWAVTNAGAADFFGYNVGVDWNTIPASTVNLAANTITLGSSTAGLDSGNLCVNTIPGDIVSFIVYTDFFNNGSSFGAGALEATISNFTTTTLMTLAEGPFVYQTEVCAGVGQVVPVSFTTPDGTVFTCNPVVDVIEYNGPTATALACNDQVNISVDEDCGVLFGADMFLEGNNYQCYDNYIIRVRPFGGTAYYDNGVPGTPDYDVNGAYLALPAGLHIYEVVDPASGVTCWGEFLIEDKFAPSLTCDCPVGGELMSLAGLEGDLSVAAGSPTGDWTAVGGCTPTDNSGDGVTPIGTATFYESFQFTTECDGLYTITATSSWGDSQIYLYDGDVDPNGDVCTNLVAWDGDSGSTGFDSELTYTATAGVVYTIYISTWADGETGTFTLDVEASDKSCGAFSITPEYADECMFLCYDETNPEVLANLPTPVVADNCGSYELASTDLWLDGDCGERILRRSWLVSDPNGFGSATCTQEFLFKAIGVDDINVPPSPIQLDCGGDASPEAIAAQYGLENAYPYYVGTEVLYDADGNFAGYGPINVAINNSVCNIFAEYTDLSIPACEGCPGNEKIVRTWKLLDWCTTETTDYTQIIKATDGEAPEISADDITVSVNPWNCVSDFYLPCPEHLHDNCYGDLDYAVEGPAGVTITQVESATCDAGYVYIASGAPKTMYDAPHQFIYTAYDCCGNVGVDTINVTVLDNTPPVAIAKENIVLSLTGSHGTDGTAKMYPGSVDNGSHDGDCGPVYLEIRREDGAPACGNIGINGHNNNETFNNDKPSNVPADAEHADDDRDDTDGGAFIKFCCEDLDQMAEDGSAYGLVKVILRVWDDGNMSGNFGDWVDLNGDGDFQDVGELDNYSDTWAWVRVEDKNGPSLVCPADVTMKCNDDYNDFGITGEAWASSNCADIGVTYTDDVNVDVCGAGYVVRTWCVEGTSFCCDQTITIDYFSDWDPCDRDRGIVWPADYTGEEDPQDPWCGRENRPKDPIECRDTDTGEPTWVDSSCDLVGTNLDSDTFFFEGNACYKVLNHWTVINWCLYNPNDADWNNISNQALDNDGDGIPNLWDNDDDDSGNPDMYYTYEPYGPEFQFYIDDLGGLYWVNYGQGTSGRDYTLDIWDMTLNGADNGYFGTFDPELEDDGLADGFYEHTQVIKFIDVNPPMISTEELCVPTSNEIETAPCGGNVQLDCEAFVTLSAIATDSLGECQSDWLKWEIFVDIWGDWTYEYEYSSFIPDISSNCPFYVDPTSPGEAVEIELPDPVAGSKYQHRVLWRVTDGCGNVASHTSYFTVEDKKDPTPYCINLSSALMEDGSVDLWACDFDAGAFDNCTPTDWLRFTFEGPEEGIESIDDIDPSTWSDDEQKCQGRTFTCDDLANADADGLIPVKVYVWDECGNVDFCVVNLRLVDNNGACPIGNPGASRISGTIMTEAGVTVDNVQVENVNEFNLMNMEMTDNNGSYDFAVNTNNMDYAVTGTKNDNFLNGVTTLDLVLIQKHILGLAELDSPYKMIAADASNDQRITAIDLVQLRKLILGIYDELPNNNSWRFVESASTMNELAPWPFDETININDLSNDMMDEDFVGVKIGDVNGSVVANINASSTELRSNEALELNSNGKAVNNTVELAITSSNFNEVFGFQFTMDAAGMVLNNVVPGALNVTSENVGVINNNLTVSWNTVDAVSTNDVLFTLVFDASEVSTVSLNSTITSAEAYVGNDLNIINVELNGSSSNDFALMQNEPNPFNNSTLIGYVLPKEGNATLTVYDVTGKVIYSTITSGTQGYNEIELSKKDINTSGVMYYQLESGDYTATKKMIILD